jgi:peptidoglycan/LPS O-acetylase OafA/YrhL
VLVAVALSLLLATLLTRWVERPAMAAIRARWRGRSVVTDRAMT